MADEVRINARAVRELVTEKFQDLAANQNVRITRGAIAEIRRIPRHHLRSGFYSVDQEKLEEALSEILLSALRFNNNLITSRTIQRAKRWSNCHYLWFC